MRFGGVFGAALRESGSAPLDHIFTHLAYYHIGQSEGALRLPPVLWGVLSVATVYFLGKRMFDKTTGFLAAALLAIMPSHIYYSQEVRPYSLPALTILLATFAFYYALGRNTRGSWALYGTTLVVGMYSHYYVAVVGILHGAYLVLMALVKRLPWNRLVPYVVAAGAAGLLFLPWVLADEFGAGQVFSWPAVRMLLSAPFVAGGPGDVLIAKSPFPSLFVGFAWACALAGAVMAIRGGSAARDNMGLLAVVSIIGVAVALMLHRFGSHGFGARHCLPFVPVLVLLVAAAALALVRAVARLPGWARYRDALAAGSAVLLVVFAIGTLLGPLSTVYRYEKQDWKSATRYLLQYADPDDVIVARLWYFVSSFYAPELAAQMTPLKDASAIEQEAEEHARVWLLTASWWRSRPNMAAWMDATKPVEVAQFGDVRLYLYSEQMSREALEASLKQW